ncbi:MAG: hypothetical protein HUU15_19515 [Candidatus Brocadiae bacterium]|nr:hypothetical protein [Candidatus Brocadiia bacterium]
MAADDDDDDGSWLRRKRRKYCIVATAAHGSGDAARVDQIRALRDRALLGTESGGAFVGTYENAAAPVAQVIAGSDVLRALVREALGR